MLALTRTHAVRLFGTAVLVAVTVATNPYADAEGSGRLTLLRAKLDGAGTHPSISSTGRYVVWVAGTDQFGQNGQVWWYDRKTRRGELISGGQGGAAPDGYASDATVSANGRFVAFLSTSSNLVAGDTNGVTDLFVRDRQLRRTIRLNVTTKGQQAKERVENATMSANGRVVAFTTSANLAADGSQFGNTPEVPAGNPSLYLAPTSGRAPVHVARATDVNSTLSVSPNGRFVAFESHKNSRLTPDDTNDIPDLYRYDVKRRSLLRITRDLTTTCAQTAAVLSSQVFTQPQLDASGNVAVFLACNQLGTEVWLRNLKSGAVKVLVPGTNASIGRAAEVAISGDGRTVFFVAQTNRGVDFGAAAYRMSAAGGDITRLTPTPGFTDNGDCYTAGWSPLHCADQISQVSTTANGRVAAFDSLYPWAKSDSHNGYDVWLFTS